MQDIPTSTTTVPFQTTLTMQDRKDALAMEKIILLDSDFVSDPSVDRLVDKLGHYMRKSTRAPLRAAL